MPSLVLPDFRELSERWQAILGRLEVETNPHTYRTCLDGAKVLRLEDGVMLVEAKNSFICDYVNDHLAIVLRRAVHAVLGEEVPVRFVPFGSVGSGGSVESAGTAMPVAARTHSRHGIIVGQVNADFTFHRYYIAEANRLAAECCRAVCDLEGSHFSPIVIYGPPGLGKTHLLHAVAGEVARQGDAVACLSAEQFTNGYLTALRGGTVADFQNTVRNVRLLVVDDLQYLSGTKKGTQDELVHTIDAVGNAGGSVVIASERHPLELDLPERLSSRLQAGITAPVMAFAGAERRTFVAHLAVEQKASLPTWAIDRIAGIEFPNVRALQGTINKAVALQRLNMLSQACLDAGITLSAVPPSLDARTVIEAVAGHFRLCSNDLVGKARNGHNPQARAVACALLHERGEQNATIAKLFNRNRSTIGPVIERGIQLLQAEPTLRRLAAG